MGINKKIIGGKKMKTNMWIVDNSENNVNSYPQLEEAASLLKKGEVVAFPTETVYGLGADATNDKAVKKIFEAKGRPSDNPLIVHIGNANQLDGLVEEVPLKAKKLIEAYWPGPLTLILKSKAGISQGVTAGLSTVGIRMPSHPVALALLQKVNLPIAAPSANLSGRPSPTTAQHVYEDLQGRIVGIVDGGQTGVGLESTVLDCTCEPPLILRPGGITKRQLEEVIGEVEVDQALLKGEEKPKSPGMKYTHYAPNAPLFIVSGTREFMRETIMKAQKDGKKVGVLSTEENHSFYPGDKVIVCGHREDQASIAASLYDSLRAFNQEDLDIIYSESFEREGLGEAIMNRLVKAAGHKIISEE